MTKTLRHELRYYITRGEARYSVRCFGLAKSAGMTKKQARTFVKAALKQMQGLAENNRDNIEELIGNIKG